MIYLYIYSHVRADIVNDNEFTCDIAIDLQTDILPHLFIIAVIIVTVQVRSLYTHKAEPATIKNLKRGVASMLMMQLKSGKMMEVKAVSHTVPSSLFTTVWCTTS